MISAALLARRKQRRPEMSNLILVFDFFDFLLVHFCGMVSIR